MEGNFNKNIGLLKVGFLGMALAVAPAHEVEARGKIVKAGIHHKVEKDNLKGILQGSEAINKLIDANTPWVPGKLDFGEDKYDTLSKIYGVSKRVIKIISSIDLYERENLDSRYKTFIPMSIDDDKDYEKIRLEKIANKIYDDATALGVRNKNGKFLIDKEVFSHLVMAFKLDTNRVEEYLRTGSIGFPKDSKLMTMASAFNTKQFAEKLWNAADTMDSKNYESAYVLGGIEYKNSTEAFFNCVVEDCQVGDSEIVGNDNSNSGKSIKEKTGKVVKLTRKK